MARKRKKGRYSKFIVLLVVILNAAFAAGALYVFSVVGSEPTALTTAWFAFTTGELWMLKDLKKNQRKEKNEDEDKLETETFE